MPPASSNPPHETIYRYVIELTRRISPFNSRALLLSSISGATRGPIYGIFYGPVYRAYVCLIRLATSIKLGYSEPAAGEASGRRSPGQQLPVAAVQTTFRSKFSCVSLSIIRMTAGVIRAQTDHSGVDTHTIYTSTHGASLHLSRHQRPFGQPAGGIDGPYPAVTCPRSTLAVLKSGH